MNMNQFTQRSLAAIQGAQELAVEHGNQQIEQEHLMLALLTDEQGFIPQLLSAMGMTVPSFAAAVKAEVEKLPKVSGGGREADKVYVAQDVDRALKAAESAAQSMKDERQQPLEGTVPHLSGEPGGGHAGSGLCAGQPAGHLGQPGGDL